MSATNETPGKGHVRVHVEEKPVKRETVIVKMEEKPVKPQAYTIVQVSEPQPAVKDDLDAVVARMKAEAAKEESEDRENGRQYGEGWAKDEATPKQLRRLESAASEGAGGESWIEDAIGVLSADDFWQVTVGLDPDEMHLTKDDDFCDGFVAGALDVWKRVRSKI